MPDTGPFSVEMRGLNGAYVIADRTDLCPGCMSDGEVDAQIRRLKQHLDRAAVQMKRAIKDAEGQPIL